MPRKLLLFAALAVVGTMVVLWLATRKSADTPTASETQSNDVAMTSEERARRERQRERGDTPALPDNPNQPLAENQTNPRSPSASSGDGRFPAATVEGVERGSNAEEPRKPYAEYTLPDGRKVRDFRKPEDQKPFDIPPSVHPPGGRRIKPELTNLFTEQIVTHIKECGKAVPNDVRGTKPRFEGQIVIAIKKEQASVTSAVFRLTEISNASIAETAQACVQQKTLTVQVPAKGESDLDAYSISLTLALL